jgi:predicted metal-dependent peptidase
MENRIELENLGSRILNASRTELYLGMHFMGNALNALGYRMDLSTRTVGTDAVWIRFNPEYLFRLYLEQPLSMNRTYMHMLAHCIFRHMFPAEDLFENSGTGEKQQSRLWDLSADMAVEYVIDSMEVPCLIRPDSDLRDEWYGRLTRETKILTAERICRYLEEADLSDEELDTLQTEFWRDDHMFWDLLRNDGKPDGKGGSTPPDIRPPLPDMNGPHGGKRPEDRDGQKKNSRAQEPPKAAALSSGERKKADEEWKKQAERLQNELEMRGKEASDAVGSLDRILSFERQRKTDYRVWLRKYAVLREEQKVDPDSFDYGLYYYGMELYGNMPLVEENEFAERRKIDELVIAIDTSGSCQAELVQKFLNGTASLLQQQENFFHRVHVHIIECDDRVQSDVGIEDIADMKQYAEGFHVRGGYGTDFRPVFTYVDSLQKKGGLRHLRGLLYFTDGFGKYPETPTKYETAFVFPKDAETDTAKVPVWAVKLYMP